ncbi:gamma-glutamylcyclotransferase family protein [Candidatus Riflebacteria bacterium]
MKYFAYGSNLPLKRLQHPSRAPSARKITNAVLKGYILKFHKISKDGSGKCDIHKTENDSDVVHGVVFEIDESDKRGLNRAEGLGYGYEQKTVRVFAGDKEIEAITYYATNIDSSFKPYHWYKNYVVAGAKENGLPADYIKMLESVESIEDPDSERRAKETLQKMNKGLT